MNASIGHAPCICQHFQFKLSCVALIGTMDFLGVLASEYFQNLRELVLWSKTWDMKEAYYLTTDMTQQLSILQSLEHLVSPFISVFFTANKEHCAFGDELLLLKWNILQCSISKHLHISWACSFLLYCNWLWDTDQMYKAIIFSAHGQFDSKFKCLDNYFELCCNAHKLSLSYSAHAQWYSLV